MLQIHTAERIRPLATRLVTVLSELPTDPMAPEWIAFPSEGMRRWLSLELARRLGASEGSGSERPASDGIAANIESAFPGSLRLRVLDAGRDPDDPDPWRVERLVWAVLDVALAAQDDPVLAPLLDVPQGGSRYGRVRRVADLFDRYHVHRADMIRGWAAGHDLDGAGRILAEHHRWQPRLWRSVRERLGTPGPPERMPELLRRLRAGELDVDLPERLAVFGLTLLPGGGSFLQLADALGAHRDLHLFLLEPSPTAAARLARTLEPTTAGAARTRADDQAGDVVEHPLLRSWGRLHRETTVLLTDAERSGLPAAQRLATLDPAPDPDVGAPTVLARLQQDIRGDVAPAGALRPDAGDRSVQLHACYGPTRQVEVLRDALLHLLADPELALSEDDVLVLCPALERFAPTIEAVLGPTAELAGGARHTERARSAPPLRYRIADRSIRSVNPVLTATAALLDLVGGRFDAPAVLDFIALAPVRARYRLDDDEVARIGDWVAETNVRWGLDPRHRAPLGVPEHIVGNTWQAATDRLLLGAAVEDDGASLLTIGDVAPHGIESDDVVTAGRLADLLWRLGELAEETRTPRPLEEWARLVRDSAGALFAAPRDAEWQIDGLLRILADLVESSRWDGSASAAALEFVDLRRLLADHLSGAPGRPDFFRGGVTISSMTPLRSVPYRVVALLGMDQSVFGAGSVDGDDLAATNPLLGDRDPRAEMRQSLLEAVLSAGDQLILLRDGRDVRTNHEVPAAVVVAELRDVLVSMVTDDERDGFAQRLEVHHPRQAFDERCFTVGELVEGRPWGFDGSALAGAEARRSRVRETPPFLDERLPVDESTVIDLADLQEFLKQPVRHFLKHRLGLRLPRGEEGISSLLPVALDGLETWKIGDRLLRTLLDGGTVDDWVRIERRLGTLPPQVLGEKVAGKVSEVVHQLVAAASERGLRFGPPEQRPIDVVLPDGTRIVGSIADHLQAETPGPVRVTYSTAKPANRVAAWLDLMAAVGTDPDVDWRSVGVNRISGGGNLKIEVIDFAPAGDPVDRRRVALDALAVAVDCYRRGSAEPIPLFPRISPQVYRGERSRSDWFHRMGFGDGDDAGTGLVYGHLELDDLVALPARPDDPGTGHGRVERFASYIWDAITGSVIDRGTAAEVDDVELDAAEVGA